MAGKGSGRREAQIKDYEDRLRWELRAKDTPTTVKDSILALLDMKQTIQIKIADISISEEERNTYRKVLNGDLPFLTTNDESNGGPFDWYFPWSEHKDVLEALKGRKELVYNLVLV